MKKCPYCAEEIQGDAIQCKHCNEWLNKNTAGLPDVQSPSVPEEEIVISTTQGDIFVDVQGIPEISAELPDRFLKFPISAPAIMEARQGFSVMGYRYARYSNLLFRGWGTYDVMCTDKKLILICVPPNGVIDSLAPLFGLAGPSLTAYESYQQIRKMRKFDAGVINTLLENGLAIRTTKHSTSRAIIAQEKVGLIETVAGNPTSRVVITGRFIYKNDELGGFIGFCMDMNAKAQRKVVEGMGITAITIIDFKVPVDSDYRDLLKFEDK